MVSWADSSPRTVVRRAHLIQSLVHLPEGIHPECLEHLVGDGAQFVKAILDLGNLFSDARNLLKTFVALFLIMDCLAETVAQAVVDRDDLSRVEGVAQLLYKSLHGGGEGSLVLLHLLDAIGHRGAILKSRLQNRHVFENTPDRCGGRLRIGPPEPATGQRYGPVGMPLGVVATRLSRIAPPAIQLRPRPINFLSRGP